jgi:hypothetical protein
MINEVRFCRTFFMGSRRLCFFTRILPLFAVSLATPLARNHQRMPLQSGLYTRVVFKTPLPRDYNLQFVRAYRTFTP